MANFLETVMLLCFGLSWPLNLVRAYKAKTAKGTSLVFLILIETGYVAGTAAKIVSGKINYVMFVYLVNFLLVGLNIIVYFLNRKQDEIQIYQHRS